nr:hypothetical protein [Burkholderia vietnamiensis]
MHYNRHRYYDPNSGRFVSKDPICSGQLIGCLLFELGGKRTTLLRHQTPLHGDLSVISWAGHIMRCKSHEYANEEEKANCSASGSGPRAAA